MPRSIANVRPIFVVQLAGELDGLNVSDVAIEGLSIEVPHRNLVGQEATVVYNLLNGVDTYDANVIRLLENIQAALGSEPDQALILSDEVARG